ncbi:DUF262 domain-containing protein [Candidatus Parabeggiatoa sp. HSG14]|uniref:GmrSD restriction endonuclease domain-containing protein n=1 Tax=Candidatus Parabeggiatoa sp. HSG14 TaxID=3055593 RepID=UPI0025A7DCF2|nr:DUF262 domain-containing protein [Thiotrichales bacterium HSG14]
MNSVESNTISIVRLIDDVEKGNIALPEFQRNFVWEVGKTYDLFDSLVKNIFIGSIIYGVPSFEITIRELDKRPKKGEGSRRKLETKSYEEDEIKQKLNAGSSFRLLLDGQQRITSIYRALHNIDEVWFVARNVDENINELILEEILFEFSGQQSSENLSIKISDVFKMMQSNYREKDIREKFFDKLEHPQNVNGNAYETVFGNYLDIKNKLQDLFKSEKLLSYYLLDTTLEKFALFFERSNSKGVQLNFIDILAAKLYKGFNLRDNIAIFEDEYNTEYYKLNKEIIVRSIAFIVLKKDVSRSGILKSLVPEHFNEYWKPVCDWYKNVLDFLYANNMVLAQSWIPYENMLIPLMMFLKEIDGDFSQISESQNKFIKFWYWAAIFAQRYTAASNEVIIQDSLVLMRIAKNEKITDRNYFYKLRSQITSADELHSYTKRSSAVYKGVLNLINYHAKGLLDWKSTSKLSSKHSKLDDHHIFPRGYITTQHKYNKDNQDVLSLVDSVVNRTLIPKITNIKIGKKSPSKYLSELQKDNPKLKHSLESHLIPVELIEGLYDDEFQDFLKERADKIFALINDNVIGINDDIKKEFYQEPKVVKAEEKKKIFANYYNKKVYADFYPKTEEILYQGKKYSSPSSAAIAAKKNISGKNTTANGWVFWKFMDEQGQEKVIDVLRENNQQA